MNKAAVKHGLDEVAETAGKLEAAVAAEVEILFRVIDELRRDGVGIVYISHRLEELIRIGDYITVLRDGKITGAQSMQGVDVSWIVRNMIGDASKSYAKAEPHALGSPVLHLEDVVLLRAGGGRFAGMHNCALRAY